MKRILFILSFIFLFSCEKPNECFESTGEIITKEVGVSAFTKIEVHRGIAIVITQGDEYKVQIQTGENLMNNVEVSQSGTVLTLKDNTTCNWLREYGQTTVYITAPNIEEIYSKTERTISSNGILNYPILKLTAVDENSDHKAGAGTGDFVLKINSMFLEINNNSLSRYYLSGSVANFVIGIYNGDGRIEAQNLLAQNVNIYHRGSNDIFVNPIQNISGSLVSTGNVYLKNNPPINTLQALYQGQIIYN